MDVVASYVSDLELAKALEKGSDKAADEFVRTHMPWMLMVAQRILRDTAAAEDSVQEAFSSAFAGIGKFEGNSTLKTWLHRIVVNQCLMMLRRTKRKAEEQLDDKMPLFDETGCRVEEPWPRLLTADEICDQKQLRSIVRQSIDRLPENFRIVLLLRDIEGFSTAEVAKQLGISESNAKVRLHRGRSALKKMLEPVLRGHLS